MTATQSSARTSTCSMGAGTNDPHDLWEWMRENAPSTRRAPRVGITLHVPDGSVSRRTPILLEQVARAPRPGAPDVNLD